VFLQALDFWMTEHLGPVGLVVWGWSNMPSGKLALSTFERVCHFRLALLEFFYRRRMDDIGPTYQSFYRNDLSAVWDDQHYDGSAW
jgi:hypothetical protein